MMEEILTETVIRIRREERRSRVLTEIERHFYERVRNTLELYSQKIKDARDKGEDDKLYLLMNDKKTIESRTEEIFRIRELKLCRLAQIKSAGGSPDLSKVNPEEMPYFNHLVNLMKNGIEALVKGKEVDFARQPEMMVQEKEEPTPPESASVEKKEIKATGEEAAPKKAKAELEEEKEEEKGPLDKVRKTPSEDMVILLAIDDLPPIAGYQKDFEIKKHDVVNVHKNRASILLTTGRVKKIGG